MPLSHSDPHSRAAAASVVATAPKQRETVFSVIQAAGRAGIAAHRIQARLKLPGNSVRPRIVELEMLGRIEKHGTGKTPSGRTCHLYRIA